MGGIENLTDKHREIVSGMSLFDSVIIDEHHEHYTFVLDLEDLGLVMATTHSYIDGVRLSLTINGRKYLESIKPVEVGKR